MPQTTNYFSFFPQVVRDTYQITNLLARAKMREAIDATQTKLFIPYTISDGERPESIAEDYYGSTAFFWIVLYANNIKNIYEDWPKTNDVLNEYIANKYSSIEYAQNIVHHFEDTSGRTIKESEWNGDLDLKVTLFDYEVKLNDAKRNIYLVRYEYRDKLAKEFRTIFNS